MLLGLCKLQKIIIVDYSKNCSSTENLILEPERAAMRISSILLVLFIVGTVFHNELYYHRNQAGSNEDLIKPTLGLLSPMG